MTLDKPDKGIQGIQLFILLIRSFWIRLPSILEFCHQNGVPTPDRSSRTWIILRADTGFTESPIARGQSNANTT